MSRGRALGALAAAVFLGGCLKTPLAPISSETREAGAAEAGVAEAGGGDLGADAPPASGCAFLEDCPQGMACELGSAECAPRRCGRPPAGEGTAMQGHNCNGRQSTDCLPGLVCVATDLWVWQGAIRAPLHGKCFQACDPCAPSCAAPGACIQLPGGGGYCALGGLAGEGEPCAGRGCQAGLSCSPCGAWCEPVCERFCLPEGEPRYGSVAASEHCRAGEVCVTQASSIDDGDYCICEEGRLAGAGFFCDGEVSTHCRAPLECELTFRICTPSPCPAEGCPPGQTCTQLQMAQTTGTYCVADNTLPFGAFCGASENCAEGLSCHMTQSPYRMCLLPDG